MALVSQSIKNLKGGISQQPDILRYPEQGAMQVNGWSSETEGLQKRPPTVFTKVLGSYDHVAIAGVDPLVHLINRDASERYYVVFTGNGIKAFDLDGREIPVSGDMGYVATTSPRTDLRLVTVADYTFIVNKNVVVRGNGVINYQVRENGECLINVRGGQYGRTLSVAINDGLPAEVKIADGGKPEDAQYTDAQFLIKALSEKLRENLPSYTIIEGAGYIHIKAPEGESIHKVTTKDGYGNQLINAVMHTAQSFSKLPVEAPDGYCVRIVGDTSKTSDQYYVQYDATKKVWREVAGWGLESNFDAHTMPHAMVRQSDGTFKVQTLPWVERKAGDDDSNPFPSIKDSTITDVFFFRNRLGFLSGENIVLSRTSKYFNLFPASVANLSDDDPIDVAVSHNRISILKYAVPFAEELLLWSDQAQFVLSASGVLSSKSAELNLTTEFDVSDSARPFGIGRGVYFASPRASYTSLSRYYAVQDVSTVKSAEDTSAHVPNYVPNGVFSIRGSGTENFVSILSSEAPNKVFIYKFLYIEEQVAQQSWSHWDFGEDVQVLACDSIGSTMFIMARNKSHTYLARVDFTKNSKDFRDEPYRLYMDLKARMLIPNGTYDDKTYTTTVDIAERYGMLFEHGDIFIVANDGKVDKFECPENGWHNGRPILHIDGNREGEWVYVGFSIPFVYEFSKFLIKKTDDSGRTSTEDTGRLQLRRAWVNYESSGAFDINVTNLGRAYKYTMGGARIGGAAIEIGGLNVGTGQFRFPVVGNAMSNRVIVMSDHTTPLNLIGCGWEGNYMRRTSGI